MTGRTPALAGVRAVFFDLDGTLADTAADLAAPANAMRVARGLEPLPLAALRPFASAGARGLIGRALGVTPADPGYAALREEFLARYEADMVVHTRLFDGMDRLLDALESAGIGWGVVSNKFERYVRPILAALGLHERSLCAIGGDTTAHPKPHPAPLLHALELTGHVATAAIYVGDDLRDVEAGQAAGMRTVAAAYGYCGDDLPPHRWGADAVIDTPAALGTLLLTAR